MTRSHPTRSRPGRLAPAKMRQPSATEILARVLDHPDLVAAVQSLPSPVLGALVARIGLEDAGEIVALATTEQIVDTFDEDLWKQDRPGGDEAFDDARFVTWLRVLREAGDAFAARRIADLSEDFLTMALHRQMLVLDSDVLERALGDVDADEAEQVDKALTSCLREELDQYQIVSRHYDGWDDVIAVVLALDREQPDLLRRVLERCRHLTESDLEEHGGLYEVLTSEEMLASDVAGEREERRLVRGFVSPSDARAFIRLARMERHGVAAGEHDAVTRAYFRALPTTQPEPTPAVQRGDRASSSVPAGVDRAAPSLPEWLGELLARAEPETVRGRLGAGDAAQTEPLLARAMHALAARDPTAHARRVEELAYLANVWIAGGSLRGRTARPIEALELVVATCSLGIELAVGGDGPIDREVARDVLLARPADDLFRLGYGHIVRDVVMPAAQELVRTLERAMETSDDQGAEGAAALLALRAALAKGEPWAAWARLDRLAADVRDRSLDALVGLIDECPWRAGAVEAERAATRSTRATFVATRADLVEIRDYLKAVSGRGRSPAR